MGRKTYEEEQITEFLELALELGFSKAMRTLGYPDSSQTAYKWARQRNVDVVKSVQQRAAVMTRYMMDETEQAEVAQQGINRVMEELFESPAISPQEHKFLADALSKHVQTLALIQGKVTSRHETIAKDQVQSEIDELMREYKAKQANITSPAEFN